MGFLFWLRRNGFSALTKLIPVWFAIWLGYSAFKYPEQFSIFALIGLANGAIYSLIAMGFGLIYSATKQINFAHGDVFMLCVVGTTYLMTDVFNAMTSTPLNWLLLCVALGLSMGFGATTSVLTEQLVFRRVRGEKAFAAITASLGIALILQNIGIKWNGSGPKMFHSVFPEALPYLQFYLTLQRTGIVLAISIPIVLAAILVVERSRNGRAIRAIADDVDTSKLMGVDVAKTIRWVFLIAGACAGAAGLIYSQHYRTSFYTIGMEVGLISYAAAIIGGVGNVRGTVAGGFFIAFVEAISDGVPSGLGYRWSQTAIYSVFILMLIYKPEGIWGEKSASKVR